jgi:desulfoferrodoxin-like iron-binding protein
MESTVSTESEAGEKKQSAAPAAQAQKSPAMQAGKRYKCAQCGTEMLVIKAGRGPLCCCGQEMQLK